MPKGVKWRGHSLYQVHSRLDEAGEYGRALMLMKSAAEGRINRLQREVKEKLIEIADELKGMEPDWLYLAHSIACPSSPTDRCIYNHREDGFHDHCLFCGEPADRG